MSQPVATPAVVEALTEGALAGATAAEMVEGLTSAGVEPQAARAAVEAVLGSPILGVARRLSVQIAAAQRSARLMAALDPEPVPEHTELDEHTLYREFWTAYRPVVLRGAASDWPAARWTWASLRQGFAFAPVDVTVRRDGWTAAHRESRRMSFDALLDLTLGPPSDHLYADGRANVLEQAGLAPLRADLGLLTGLVGDGHPKAWVGPAGTITPTHHDLSTAWQVLLLGRKRIHLASPLQPALAGAAVGLFNTIDPTGAARDDVVWHTVELTPGDALFVPAGWWHRVEALEPSFSVSFSGFRWPNEFGWLVPPDANVPTRTGSTRSPEP